MDWKGHNQDLGFALLAEFAPTIVPMKPPLCWSTFIGKGCCFGKGWFWQLYDKIWQLDSFKRTHFRNDKNFQHSPLFGFCGCRPTLRFCHRQGREGRTVMIKYSGVLTKLLLAGVNVHCQGYFRWAPQKTLARDPQLRMAFLLDLHLVLSYQSSAMSSWWGNSDGDQVHNKQQWKCKNAGGICPWHWLEAVPDLPRQLYPGGACLPQVQVDPATFPSDLKSPNLHLHNYCQCLFFALLPMN